MSALASGVAGKPAPPTSLAQSAPFRAPGTGGPLVNPLAPAVPDVAGAGGPHAKGPVISRCGEYVFEISLPRHSRLHGRIRLLGKTFVLITPVMALARYDAGENLDHPDRKLSRCSALRKRH
jgi:hypothetical protein